MEEGGRRGRQIRNEFFCFGAPRKTSNAKENDSRLLPDGGEPRRATSSRGETRKESKEAVRVCETFSAAHVCSLRESRKPGTPIRAGPRSCKIRGGVRACVQRRERARARGNIRFYFRNL